MEQQQNYNLHYAYNVDYFQGLDLTNIRSLENINTIKAKNQALTQWRTTAPTDLDEICTHKLQLQTTYPGMITGTGNLHMVGCTSELSLGFLCDYVTGSPYISGSSVKGVLRSAFQHESMIRALLDMPQLNVAALAACIFDGTTEDEQPLPPWQRDIFFDAFPVGENQRTLALDAFCFHGSNPTRNPSLVNFLKVRPDTVFCFRFRLRDTQLDNCTITGDQKLGLFKMLLMLFGVGAKTNYGYGTFTTMNK